MDEKNEMVEIQKYIFLNYIRRVVKNWYTWAKMRKKISTLKGPCHLIKKFYEVTGSL